MFVGSPLLPWQGNRKLSCHVITHIYFKVQFSKSQACLYPVMIKHLLPWLQKQPGSKWSLNLEDYNLSDKTGSAVGWD